MTSLYRKYTKSGVIATCITCMSTDILVGAHKCCLFKDAPKAVKQTGSSSSSSSSATASVRLYENAVFALPADDVAAHDAEDRDEFERQVFGVLSNTVLMPCGHVQCRSCADKLMRRPVGRTKGVLPAGVMPTAIALRCQECRHVFVMPVADNLYLKKDDKVTVCVPTRCDDSTLRHMFFITDRQRDKIDAQRGEHVALAKADQELHVDVEDNEPPSASMLEEMDAPPSYRVSPMRDLSIFDFDESEDSYTDSYVEEDDDDDDDDASTESSASADGDSEAEYTEPPGRRAAREAAQKRLRDEELDSLLRYEEADERMRQRRRQSLGRDRDATTRQRARPSRVMPSVNIFVRPMMPEPVPMPPTRARERSASRAAGSAGPTTSSHLLGQLGRSYRGGH